MIGPLQGMIYPRLTPQFCLFGSPRTRSQTLFGRDFDVVVGREAR